MKFDASSVRFPSSISVTDQEIDISQLTAAQRSYYTDLLQRIFDIYESRRVPRVVIGILGPTGSGKSLSVALLSALAKQIQTPFAFHTVGIDGYHFTNEYLQTHSVDGTTFKEQKGAPDTYDVEHLAADVTQFREGETVSFPAYSRITHEPIPDVHSIADENALLLLEGLWLLYEKSGWEHIGPLLDFSIFIDADQEHIRDSVLARHVRGGRSPADAVAYYESVDALNSEKVAQSKKHADLIIPAYYKVE